MSKIQMKMLLEHQFKKGSYIFSLELFSFWDKKYGIFQEWPFMTGNSSSLGPFIKDVLNQGGGGLPKVNKLI